MEQEMQSQKSAKTTRTISSRKLNARVRDCVLAGDLDGALRLMNGMITDKVHFMLRNKRIDESTKEDCIQETLILIMNKWHLIQNSDDPLSYVRKMTTRFIIDVIRKNGRVREVPIPDMDPNAESPIMMEFEQALLPSQDKVLLISETQNLFKQALQDVYKQSPDCEESLGLYQEAQNNDEKFDAFCHRLGLEHQTLYARFRRCVGRIIDHHLYPKFWNLVARLYPNVLRSKQQANRPKENNNEL